MNMVSLKVLLTLALAGCVFGAESSEEGNAVTEANMPPNEWGCYYDLPNRRGAIKRAFDAAMKNYLKTDTKKTECKLPDAEFERWFVSSKNPNHYIFSYYCRTKSARGFEHIKVELKNDEFVKVLDFQGSLKGYGIVDAGDYETDLSEKEGREILNNLLPNITAQIAEQKNSYDVSQELCPDPSDETFMDVWTKKENGLTYYKLAISCNITDVTGYGADFKTTIEVAEDNEYNLLNDGKPVLVAMEEPSSNIVYIQEKERNAAKQTDGDGSYSPTLAPIVALIVVCVFPNFM